jgi:protein JSN1
MLERLAPYLAMIGIHKNGTWAAQKIIECVNTPEEIALVTQHLRAYTPPLLLDQFGNYVVQFVEPENT